MAIYTTQIINPVDTESTPGDLKHTMNPSRLQRLKIFREGEELTLIRRNSLNFSNITYNDMVADVAAFEIESNLDCILPVAPVHCFYIACGPSQKPRYSAAGVTSNSARRSTGADGETTLVKYSKWLCHSNKPHFGLNFSNMCFPPKGL